MRRLNVGHQRQAPRSSHSSYGSTAKPFNDFSSLVI